MMVIIKKKEKKLNLMDGLRGNIMTSVAYNFVSITVVCIAIFVICCAIYGFLNPEE